MVLNRDAILLLTQAYELAARAHASQRRKGFGDIPYINHPCAVAALAAAALPEGDFEAVAAAILHDVLEDTEVTAAELTAQFGWRVASLVGELTDAQDWLDLPMPERKGKQAEKMAHASIEARIIKIADQTGNIRDLCNSIEAWPRDHHLAYLAGTQWVVDACRGVAPALEAAFDQAARDFREAIDKEPKS